jgi:osmotically-inducible protein OsmY
MDKVPDSAILKKVNERLGRAGTGGTARVTASVRSGQVTLAGTLQYEMQRAAMVKAANSVAGVSRVVDRMTIAEKKRVF